MKKTALSNPAYVAFTRARDKALEQFLQRQQKRSSNVLVGALIRIESHIRMFYPRVIRAQYVTNDARLVETRMKAEIKAELDRIVPELCQIIARTRQITYLFTDVAEAEALARATGKARLPKDAKDKAAMQTMKPSLSGGRVEDNVQRAMDKLAFDISRALNQSRIYEEALDEALARVDQELPKVKRTKGVPNSLIDPKLKEADPGQIFATSVAGKNLRMLSDFLDDDTWRDLTKALQDPVIAQFRSADTVFDVPDADGQLEERFGWEIERDMTDEFVRAVRDAKGDAASENGVQDFVWIAVVDDRTDECCLWRDGLTTKEIEAKLKSVDDDCDDAIVPPAHPNCRCDIAPVTEDLVDSKPYDFGKFEDWLDS